MKPRLHTAALAAALSIIWCCQSPVTRTPGETKVTYNFDRALAVLQDAVDDNILAGAIGFVAQDDEIIFQETVGMADREAVRPMNRDTIFRIASMTKPVTSVAVMMLYEKGHFELDDPVPQFIPEFKNPSVLQSRGSETRGRPRQEPDHHPAPFNAHIGEMSRASWWNASLLPSRGGVRRATHFPTESVMGRQEMACLSLCK